MDWQGALRARLTAAASVIALVAQRIYWVDRPQASSLPAITLQTIDDGRPRHFDGFQDTRSSVVQIDVWATTYAQCRTLAEAVIAALAPEAISNGIRFLRSDVDGVRDMGERVETQFIHRTSIDLIVWHSPA